MPSSFSSDFSSESAAGFSSRRLSFSESEFSESADSKFLSKSSSRRFSSGFFSSKSLSLAISISPTVLFSNCAKSSLRGFEVSLSKSGSLLSSTRLGFSAFFTMNEAGLFSFAKGFREFKSLSSATNPAFTAEMPFSSSFAASFFENSLKISAWLAFLYIASASSGRFVDS